MSDDYLWDRSGKPDRDVEKLEQMLGQLRQDVPPPDFGQVPTKVHAFPRRRMYRWMAVAAAAVVAVFGDEEDGELAVALRPRRVVFARWHGDQFITIPNFPGWVCDVCGEREYDAVALEQVQSVLGAEQDLRRETTGRSVPRRAPSHRLPPRITGGHV